MELRDDVAELSKEHEGGRLMLFCMLMMMLVGDAQ